MSRRQRLLLFAETRVEELWRKVDPYDGRAVQEFSEAAAQIVLAAQAQAVSLTAATQLAYLSEVGVDLEFVPEVPDEVRMFGERESKYAKPKNVKVGGKTVLRLPVEEIFNRPAREYRAKVAGGMPEDKALEHSVNRAKIFMGTNVSLAEREATRQMFEEANRKSQQVTGWRRVIHPEASTTGVCGLCLAASDRIYGVEDLKPIHDHCNCEVLPITVDNDPGDELNIQDLRKLYDVAGGTAAKHLGKVHYKVDEHGELGPVLVPPRKKYTVPHFYYRDTEPSIEAVDLDALQEKQLVAA